MGISLQHPKLSLEDKMYLIKGRVQHEMANPPLIPTREFYQKIKKAAREVGITHPQVYEWDRSLSKSWFSDGCLREARLLHSKRKMSHDHDKDIGYLQRNDDGKYTVRLKLMTGSFLMGCTEDSRRYWKKMA